MRIVGIGIGVGATGGVPGTPASTATRVVNNGNPVVNNGNQVILGE